jgi:hypothetical protein
MAELVLNAPRIVAGIGQRTAARMTQHVRVNRKSEAGASADALDEFDFLAHRTPPAGADLVVTNPPYGAQKTITP